MIACGNCKGHHKTVDEVRDCCKVNPPKEIDLSIPDPSLPQELLDAHRKVMEIFGDGRFVRDEWPRGEMAPEGFYRVPVQIKLEAVDWCNQSGDPSYCTECKVELPLEYKVYFEFGHHSGGESRCKEHEYTELIRTEHNYVKVQLNQSGSRRYAKRLHTVQAVVDGKLEITSATWEFEPGLIKEIKPSHELTEEQAAEFGQLYGWCCICGRRLTNEDSIARGIGPVCAENQGW